VGRLPPADLRRPLRRHRPAAAGRPGGSGRALAPSPRVIVAAGLRPAAWRPRPGVHGHTSDHIAELLKKTAMAAIAHATLPAP
jgi:hypothetical protein